MVITSVKNLGKGIVFAILLKGIEYSLIINEAGKTWFVCDSEGITKSFNEIKAEIVLKKLERAFKDVRFVPKD